MQLRSTCFAIPCVACEFFKKLFICDSNGKAEWVHNGPNLCT